MNGTKGPNLVVNPDFTEGLNGWVMPMPEAVTYMERTAVRFTTLLSSSIGQRINGPFQPGPRYRFQYLAASDLTDSEIRLVMSVTAVYSDGGTFTDKTNPIFLGPQWSSSDNYSFPLDRQADEFLVRFEVLPGANVTGNVYVTEVIVREE